jgi:2-polyprenyl-3-methyl-5-hydroxy-6-metoxy-1,4-benzoquinol methylase
MLSECPPVPWMCFKMKTKLKAENPLEWMALKLNLAPSPLIDTQVAFTAARAIMTAAELGIFEAIGKLARTADDIAQTCETHPRSTKQLLDCLVGVGYLQWRGKNYSLKRKYQKWLLKESESNLIGKMRFQLLEWNWMAKLEDYVRSGNPLELHSTVSEREWRLYQEAMRDLSFNAAKELAGKIPVPRGAVRMLDIGGSHGLYSIEICKRHPALTSTILELPGAIESASAIAKRYDKSGRVKYVAGNALTDDLGTNRYDLVLINNVVHHFTADQNMELAVKVAHALKPGGVYAIGDAVRAETPGEGGVAASTSGLYFSLISSSGNWSNTEMESWQKAAGLKPEKTVAAMSIPGWKMLIAIKMS